MSEGGAAATLLVELVTEELPPKALKALGNAFAETLHAELGRRNVLTDATAVVAYATPRRLAVTLTHVRAVAPDAEIVERLMPRSVAEDAAAFAVAVRVASTMSAETRGRSR